MWEIYSNGEIKLTPNITGKEMREKLNGFYESDAGKMTMKELLSGTANVILQTMVQKRAPLELGIWIDLKETLVQVPV